MDFKRFRMTKSRRTEFDVPFCHQRFAPPVSRLSKGEVDYIAPGHRTPTFDDETECRG